MCQKQPNKTTTCTGQQINHTAFLYLSLSTSTMMHCLPFSYIHSRGCQEFYEKSCWILYNKIFVDILEFSFMNIWRDDNKQQTTNKWMDVVDELTMMYCLLFCNVFMSCWRKETLWKVLVVYLLYIFFLQLLWTIKRRQHQTTNGCRRVDHDDDVVVVVSIYLFFSIKTAVGFNFICDNSVCVFLPKHL